MKNSRNENLSEHLLNVDEDILDRAYEIDDAEKLRQYVKSKNTKAQRPFYLTPMFRSAAAMVACFVFIIAAVFAFPDLLDPPGFEYVMLENGGNMADNVGGNGTTDVGGNGTTNVGGNGTTDVGGNGTTDVGGNGTTDVGGNGMTNVGGNGTTDVGGNGTTDAVNDGMVRTVLNGGGQGAASLPYYVSTEVVKRCLITDGTVKAKIYLGHDRWFGDLVYFTDLERPLTMDELKECTFSIVAYYNNGKNYVEIADGMDYSSNLYDVSINDLWDGNDYNGCVVSYSQFEQVELDIGSMLGVSYGYIIFELRITLPDGSQAGVMSDSVYYSVTDTEIVFGLVSNPIAHEGDDGIITHGWTYAG